MWWVQEGALSDITESTFRVLKTSRKAVAAARRGEEDILWVVLVERDGVVRTVNKRARGD